jgi:sugar O-acyltransferase (sialic acid O-acetyltransferase NeuD family)
MLYLLGAGGHCKVVLDALLRAGMPKAAIRIRDGDRARADTAFMGIAVEWPETSEDLAGQQVHVSIGSAALRARFYERCFHLKADPFTIRHPAAAVSDFADLAGGVFLAAGSVVAPGATVGLGVIVNHGAIVDHDCTVGAYCHIGPNAALGGGVHIGDSVLVGAGATILPGLTVKSGAVVGAGAVVTRDIGPNEVWTGVPAKQRIGDLNA